MSDAILAGRFKVHDIQSIQGRLACALEEAMQQAKRSKKTLFAHGAVVWSGNRIYAVGCNQPRCVRFSRITSEGTLFDNSGHAEMMALSRLQETETSLSLLVVRWRRKGSLGLSRPCEMCMPKLMARSGLARVYWSLNENQIVEMRIER